MVLFQERDFLLGQGIPVVDFSMRDERNFESAQVEYFVENIDYQNTGGSVSKLRQAAKFVHSTEAVRNISALAANEKPDIVHLHNIYHQLTPSFIPPLKRAGSKVVLTLHDYKLVCPCYVMLSQGQICDACTAGDYTRAFKRRCGGGALQSALLSVEAYWHAFRKSYEQVDLFIAPSEFMAGMIARRVPRSKIRILPNGIDTAAIKFSEADLGYGLYFGRLSLEKGVETLLKAHRSLPGSPCLKIVGTGPLEAELKSRYPQADFLGYKQGRELEDLVAGAGFVIAPSECNENCSMMILEAMAHAKPVIGSRVGGIPEQVLDGQTGMLFEMGNADDLARCMEELYGDEDLRRRLGLAARQRLEERYSLKRHCEGLMEIYQELMEMN